MPGFGLLFLQKNKVSAPQPITIDVKQVPGEIYEILYDFFDGPQEFLSWALLLKACRGRASYLGLRRLVKLVPPTSHGAPRIQNLALNLDNKIHSCLLESFVSPHTTEQYRLWEDINSVSISICSSHVAQLANQLELLSNLVLCKSPQFLPGGQRLSLLIDPIAFECVMSGVEYIRREDIGFELKEILTSAVKSGFQYSTVRFEAAGCQSLSAVNDSQLRMEELDTFHGMCRLLIYCA